MIANQEQLLEEGDRLDKLRRSYDGDDAVDESYVVLTIGASLIATLGLLANNAAVVIGAMVVAPWILPLRALVFGSLIGDRKLLFRALITLATGVVIPLCCRKDSVWSPVAMAYSLLILFQKKSQLAWNLRFWSWGLLSPLEPSQPTPK